MTIEQDIVRKLNRILELLKGGNSSSSEETIDVSGKADKVNNAVNGHIAALNENGNLTDSGVSPSDLMITNREFPNNWPKSGTISDLLTAINADDSAVRGTSYLSTVRYEDLPEGVMQAEMLVEIMESQNYGKVIVLTVTSSDVAPYHWEYTSAWGRTNRWRTFVTEQENININSMVNILNALKLAGKINDYTLTYNQQNNNYDCTIS